MNDFDVRWILVDPGSSADLLQAFVIKQMGFSPSNLENPGRILSGFNGAFTTSLGDIVLPVQTCPITLNVQFSLVEDLSPFNAILGHIWLHGMKVIPSTYHHMVSYLTEDGKIDLYGSQLAAQQCYPVAREAGSGSDNEHPLELVVTADQEQLQYSAEKDPPAADPLQIIQILGEDDHFTHASSLLELDEAQCLEKVLQQNKDVFTWTHSDMLEIHPSITSHRLNILPSSRPIGQKVQ